MPLLHDPGTKWTYGESTRVLGHLVSLLDFEVEAARYGGVIRAKALWAWDEVGEDAVVKERLEDYKVKLFAKMVEIDPRVQDLVEQLEELQ